MTSCDCKQCDVRYMFLNLTVMLDKTPIDRFYIAKYTFLIALYKKYKTLMVNKFNQYRRDKL